MTVTFEIPEDIQADVSGIPDIGIHVALFLRHEAQLESVRRSPLSTQAREIASRAMPQAQRDQKDWDASFETLKQQQQAITAKL